MSFGGLPFAVKVARLWDKARGSTFDEQPSWLNQQSVDDPALSPRRPRCLALSPIEDVSPMLLPLGRFSWHMGRAVAEVPTAPLVQCKEDVVKGVNV